MASRMQTTIWSLFLTMELKISGQGFKQMPGRWLRRLNFADTEGVTNLQIAVQQNFDPVRSFLLERHIHEGFDIGRRGFRTGKLNGDIFPSIKTEHWSGFRMRVRCWNLPSPPHHASP